MENSYEYLDPDFEYSDKNGILYNIPNIRDEEILAAFESLRTSRRLVELAEQPIKIVDSGSLLKIHFHLFQDVYVWAGKVRTVNISKNGKPFFSGERFDRAFQYLDSLIESYKKIKSNDKQAIADKLAEILDNVNYLHPFREGNGRVQREFIRLLALEKGLILNLNPPDDRSVYERYMRGTIEGDVRLLASLIYDLIGTGRE